MVLAVTRNILRTRHDLRLSSNIIRAYTASRNLYKETLRNLFSRFVAKAITNLLLLPAQSVDLLLVRSVILHSELVEPAKHTSIRTRNRRKERTDSQATFGIA